jgi:20S proteasome subunit alpha 7
LACEKIKASPLQVKDSNKRIFNVDRHIGLAITGRIPDGMIVLERARKEAENYKEFFGIPITGRILTERIANYIHAHTLYGQFRPFGVNITIVSHDNNEDFLYAIDNTGVFRRYYAVATGKGKQIAKTMLEKIGRNQDCRQNLEMIAKTIVSAHEEFKEKTYEFEASWISDETHHQHVFVDFTLREELKNKAEEELDE